MYKHLIRPLLFSLDPEYVHHLSFTVLGILLSIPGIKQLMGQIFTEDDPVLQTEAFGLTFKNPVGLAAGFDKDAKLVDKWQYLGFGFVEVGTVTPRPQVGNPKKRLFRLPQDKAIINRMGFNNAGLEAMVNRLKKLDQHEIIIGANIGKNKDTPNEQAAEDYEKCFQALFPYVDYFVVNVSSPNTPGLRDLQEKEPLTRLLLRLQELNNAQTAPKPLLLKIAPDLSESQLLDIIEVVRDTQLSGLIATNTTISREGLTTPAEAVKQIGNGGLSGAPLTARSQEVVAFLSQKTQGTLPMIGVGGIMGPKDAHERLEAGTSLIQTYTGFVYQGPGFAKRVCKSLAIARKRELSH
ncbi:MAG: quinone-dependent dihydroorotate dehydrogenase [Bacteroidota bacterium]